MKLIFVRNSQYVRTHSVTVSAPSSIDPASCIVSY